MNETTVLQTTPGPRAPARRRLGPWIPALWAIAVLQAGCAAYSPQGVTPGASVGDAERAMGKTTGTYPLPGGGQRLEFARGPQGKHTYMLDFDAQGRLLRSEQVLNEAHFAQVRPGDGEQQVLARIGHPGQVTTVGRPGYYQSVWTYRYDSAPFCLWFQVGLSPAGQVIDSTYAPDPACESKD